MASHQAVSEEKLRKGPWHDEEEEQLIKYVTHLGERRWDYIARKSGLKRSGKSCRLRWLNYLRPNIKHGDISSEEEEIIVQLHEQWGNKWSRIARGLPGRTDNEIKNYWRTHLKRKIEARKQENSQRGINNAARQDPMVQKFDFNRQKYDCNDQKSGASTFGTSNASFDAVEYSDFVFTSSPYEVRLLDWMAELSDDPSASGHNDEFSCAESCYCFQEMICEDNDTWGWSGSIWDMN